MKKHSKTPLCSSVITLCYVAVAAWLALGVGSSVEVVASCAGLPQGGRPLRGKPPVTTAPSTHIEWDTCGRIF